MRRKRGEVALFVVAAAADGESKAVDCGARRRRCDGPSHLAHLVARAEAIPVLATGSRPVTSTCTLCPSSGRAIADALLHDGTGGRRGQSPTRRRPRRRHASAFERLRRKTGPQHHTVRKRIAGGDAERERVSVEERRGEERRVNSGGATAAAPSIHAIFINSRRENRARVRS